MKKNPMKKNQFFEFQNPNRIEITIDNENVIQIPVFETKKYWPNKYIQTHPYNFITISYTKVRYTDVKKFIDGKFDNFHYVYKTHSDVITRSRCRAYCIDGLYVYFITFGFLEKYISTTGFSSYECLNVYNKWVRCDLKRDLDKIATDENWHWLV